MSKSRIRGAAFHFLSRTALNIAIHPFRHLRRVLDVDTAIARSTGQDLE